MIIPGSTAQLEVSPTADQGVTHSIPAWSHSFMRIDHVNNFYDNSPRSADLRRTIVSYEYMHEVLLV